MKKLHIAGIAATGVVGTLLLGGGAFAAGSALGESVRSERGYHNEQARHHSDQRGDQENGRSLRGTGGDHDCCHEKSSPDDTTVGPQRTGRRGLAGGPGGGSFASVG